MYIVYELKLEKYILYHDYFYLNYMQSIIEYAVTPSNSGNLPDPSASARESNGTAQENLYILSNIKRKKEKKHVTKHIKTVT